MVDQKKARELRNRVAAIDLRRSAAISEYTAAALLGDRKERDRLRDNLHTFLDAHLDAIDEMVREVSR